jgi:ATP-binding cassette subfamily A (ABC1) protein 3
MEGFLTVQRAMDLSIVYELGGGQPSTMEKINQVSLQLKSFPYPPYADDEFIFILTTQFPFIVMLSFIVTAPTICKDVVLEKEKKLKVSHQVVVVLLLYFFG